MMPTVRSLVTRVLSPLIRAAEGPPRPGPYYLPVSGGWLPAGVDINWWQQGYSPISGGRLAIIEACISAYSQTCAMLPGDHWRSNNCGGRARVTTSALSRILRAPNAYQTISDFLLNAVRSLYLNGNAYALAIRNDRYEIDELHLMDPNQLSPAVVRADNDAAGNIFYRLGGNEVIEAQIGSPQIMVPARDVLHIRLHSNRRYPSPLLGETPLAAAFGDIVAYDAIRSQQDQFFRNQARPSAVLSTDLNLDANQLQQLRDRWNEQAKGLSAGGTPILTHGLKVLPWATNMAKDLQVAEQLKLANENIALVFRIPLAILGLGGAPLGATEQLMKTWLSLGLGFCLNHVEEAFGKLFGLAGQPDEYCEFDTAALLRSDAKDRIDGLVRAVQGGVLSPNEARNQEGFDSVPYGDEPRVQAQVVPLSAAGAIPTAPTSAVPPSAPATRSYRRAVQHDAKALMARANGKDKMALDGVVKPVIRKTKVQA
jgi:HK97 family phage portal protein